MKNILLALMASFFVMIFIPMMLTQRCDGINESRIALEEKEIILSDQQVRVYIEETKKVQTMDLEEYIKGVLAGEMPAAFEMEALKAQAVAARSYAVSRMNLFKEKGNANHPEAELCDTTHCQVWLSDKKLIELKSKGWMEKYWPRIEEAVESTKGLILTYQGRPVEQPLFHSTSGGRTENSEDVFTSAVPYLRSVESPYEQKAPFLTEDKVITVDHFVSKIKSKYKDSNIKASDIASSIKLLERSEGGRVLKLQVGNKEFTGREIRDLLGLKSANFKITLKGKEMIFTTVGYGHGVGMSQWGANGMAEQGYKFDEILKHYYVGVEVEEIR